MTALATNLGRESGHILTPSEELELRQQAIGDDGKGGYTVGKDFVRRVFTTLREGTSLIRAGATIVPSRYGNKTLVPATDDAGEEGILTNENTGPIAQGDFEFSQTEIPVYTGSSKRVLASREFLQDSATHGLDSIADRMGRRLGRLINRMGTIGTGVDPNPLLSQPRGFTLDAIDSGVAAAGSLDFSHLQTLKSLVHHDYWEGPRRTGCWMVSENDYPVVRGVAGSSVGGWESAVPGDDCVGWLDGNRLIINDNLADGKVYFGDFSYVVIRVKISDDEIGQTIESQVPEINVARLEETYAGNLQVGFIGYCRFGAALVDPSQDDTPDSTYAPLKFLTL